MVYAITALALLALGFGLGRVKHPANLKVAAIKAKIAELEAEGKAETFLVLAKIKALL
jgi:hypothetical protein